MRSLPPFGERIIYYLLAELDPEFPALFKINADMESEIKRNPANTVHYAQLIATLARRAQLRLLSAAAVVRLIEHAAHLASKCRAAYHQDPAARRPDARGRPFRHAGHKGMQ